MIEVGRKNFERAVATAALALQSRNTVPILSALRVQANGALTVAGTDLDIMIEARAECSGDPATFMLPEHRSVTHALKALGDEQLTIAVSNDDIDLHSGTLALRRATPFDSDEWPALDIHDQHWAATLTPEAIAAFARIMPAVSREETRYYLNGIYVHHLADWTWRAVATDGHRLLVADFALPDADGSLEGQIIPRRAADVICSQFGKTREPARIRAGLRHVENREVSTAPERRELMRIEVAGEGKHGPCRIVAKVIDGTYPDYTRVIPKDHPHAVVVDRGSLRSAGAGLAWPGVRAPALKLTAAKGSITVAAAFLASGEGSASVTVPIADESNIEAGFEIGFNGGYLIEMLDAVGGNQVVIGLTDSAAPATLRNPEDTSILGVLMPMRV